MKVRNIHGKYKGGKLARRKVKKKKGNRNNDKGEENRTKEEMEPRNWDCKKFKKVDLKEGKAI